MRTVDIVTERLRLRPFERDDLEAFVAYRSDPEVARYQSWDHPYSMSDAYWFKGEWSTLRLYARLEREWRGTSAR